MFTKKRNVITPQANSVPVSKIGEMENAQVEQKTDSVVPTFQTKSRPIGDAPNPSILNPTAPYFFLSRNHCINDLTFSPTASAKTPSFCTMLVVTLMIVGLCAAILPPISILVLRLLFFIVPFLQFSNGIAPLLSVRRVLASAANHIVSLVNHFDSLPIRWSLQRSTRILLGFRLRCIRTQL